MNKKEKLAFAVVAALAMTSGGFAVAQTINPVSSDQVINACVTGLNGNITKVSNTQKTCPKGTTPISWNKVGPQGQPGIQGIQGPKGDAGASYTDDMPVINGIDPNSFVLQVGWPTCMGGSMRFTQTGIMCTHQIDTSGMLIFYDVQASGSQRGGPAAEMKFYIVAGSCPASDIEAENLRRFSNQTGYLISGSAPFGYELSSTSSCLLLESPNSAGMGIYHVAVKIN